MCGDIRYFKSSIPPKLQGDRIGSLVFTFLSFNINEEIDRTETRFRLMLWGQDDGIDIYHDQFQNQVEVSVEYPLVGSIDIVRRYFFDMGVLVLPIMNGEQTLLGLANIHLSEIFGGLLQDLEKGNYDANLTSCISISTPLISFTRTNEKCHQSFQSARFGELGLKLELTVEKLEKFDVSVTSIYNKGVRVCNTTREGGDLKEIYNMCSGRIVSARDNGHRRAIHVVPSKLYPTPSLTDTTFNGLMNVFQENLPSGFDIIKNRECRFPNLDDNNFSLATEDDSILLAAILETPRRNVSEVHEDFGSDDTSRISLDKMSDARTSPLGKQCEQKIAQNVNLSKQSSIQNKSIELRPTLHVISLHLKSVNLTRPCLSPLLHSFKGRQAVVKGWIEFAIPSPNDPQLNTPQIISVPFICKTIGRTKQGKNTGARTNARGRNRLMKSTEKQLLAYFETCHDLSHRKVWNVKINNNRGENELQHLIIQMNIFAAIEETEKGQIIKLGVAQLKLGAMLREKESYTDFCLPFGPISTNMSFINLDIDLLVTNNEVDVKSKQVDSACSSIVKAEDKSLLEGDSSPRLACDYDKKVTKPTNTISILKDDISIKEESEKVFDMRSQCPKLMPHWIYIRVSSLRDLIKITRKSKILIKVCHLSTSRIDDETPSEYTILGETITLKDFAALYFTRVLMLEPCCIVSKKFSDSLKIDVREHIGTDSSSSILNTEISIPLNLNFGSSKANDVAFFFADKMLCKSQIKGKCGIHMEFTVAIGSLEQIDYLEMKIESSTKLQRWWNRRKLGNSYLARGSKLTTAKEQTNHFQLQKCAKIIQHAWRRQRLCRISNDKKSCDRPNPSHNDKSNFTTKITIKRDISLQNRERISLEKSDDNGSLSDLVQEDKLQSITKYATHEVEIKLGTCIGIREMLALWEEGRSDNTNLNINRSGVFVAFSILARSKENPSNQPEMMQFSTAIKMIKTIKRHQIMFDESYRVWLDNSDVIMNYIQSEMMEVQLWFVPVVTDLRKKYHPSYHNYCIEMPEKASMVGTTKCPLYMLTGSTCVSYFCPWQLEKENDIDTVGKIQITFRLNGNTTDELSVIDLESSFPSSSRNIFDWDLPDQIERILSTENPNRQSKGNFLEDSITQITIEQCKETGGTKLSSEKTELLCHGQENSNNSLSYQANSQKNTTKRNRKLKIPNVCKSNRGRFEGHHHNTSYTKNCGADTKFFSDVWIKTESPYLSKFELCNSDVIERVVAEKSEDILPTPKDNALFQLKDNYMEAPSKIYGEEEPLGCAKCIDKLTSNHYSLKEYQCLDVPEFKMHSPVGEVISSDTKGVTPDMNSDKYSVSSEDMSIYTQETAVEVKKVELSRLSSDESSADLKDPQQITSRIAQIYKPSSSSSSSSASEKRRSYFVTSNLQIGNRMSQSGGGVNKYSDDDSSSCGSFSVTQSRYERSREEISDCCHEDEVSTSEIESIDLSSDSSTWS